MMIFKQKVIDDIAPHAVTERIRAFLKTLFVDYQAFSGQDVTPLLNQVDKFCLNIRNHQNYLIDIYNKENVYNRRV